MLITNDRLGELGRCRDRRPGWAAVVLSALVLAGCTSVQTDEQYAGAKLPRPDVILVQDFAISPDEVKLDRGFSAEIARAIKSAPRSEEERTVGKNVVDALADKLVAEIRDLGLPAAKGIAKHLAVFFAQQGWITKG